MADRPTRVRAAGYDATASLVATMRDTAVDAKDDAETAKAAAESAQSGAASSASSAASSASAAASSATAAEAARDLASEIAIGDADAALAGAILNEASDTHGALNASYARKALLPAARLRTWGHSIMHGSTTSTGGAVIGTSDMATLIAAGLGLPLDQQAVSGASLYINSSAADWSDILQYEVRPSKFATLGGVYALMYGINDGAQLGNTDAALAPFRSALRTAVARLRCSAVFEDTDSSVTLGGSGTWTVGVNTAFNSGSSYSYNPTSGGTITITTPASFPGGTIDLGFVTWGDGGGGTITGPASLGSPTVNTTTISGTDGRRVAVMRVANVPTGAASYVFTTSSVTGSAGVIFDWWGWEPAESRCPIVALIAQPKPLDYTSQSGAPAGPVGDAGVDVINAINSDVAAEFGTHTLYIDTSYYDKNTNGTFWEAGNIHPSAAAHSGIAALVVDAVAALLATEKAQLLPVELNSASASSAAPAWTSYTPTLAGNGTSLGNGTVAGEYIKRSDGTVSFRAIVTLGSTSVIGTNVTISLPVTAASGTKYVALQGHHDTGAGTVKPLFVLNNTTTTAFLRTADGTNVNATNPVAYASGQKLDIRGEYRAA